MNFSLALFIAFIYWFGGKYSWWEYCVYANSLRKIEAISIHINCPHQEKIVNH